MRPLNAASANALPVQVPSSLTAVQLFPENRNTLGRTIFNDSTSILHVRYGTGASATSKNVEIAANGYFEFPVLYTGVVTGLWDSADGNAYCTDFG